MPRSPTVLSPDGRALGTRERCASKRGKRAGQDCCAITWTDNPPRDMSTGARAMAHDDAGLGWSATGGEVRSASGVPAGGPARVPSCIERGLGTPRGTAQPMGNIISQRAVHGRRFSVTTRASSRPRRCVSDGRRRLRDDPRRLLGGRLLLPFGQAQKPADANSRRADCCRRHPAGV